IYTQLNSGNEVIKLTPQVWSRIFPICEGSERCQRGAEILTRTWRKIDDELKGWTVINSWQNGLKNIGKSSFVVFTKAQTLPKIARCKVCATTFSSKKCSRCRNVL